MLLRQTEFNWLFEVFVLNITLLRPSCQPPHLVKRECKYMACRDPTENDSARHNLVTRSSTKQGSRVAFDPFQWGTFFRTLPINIECRPTRRSNLSNCNLGRRQFDAFGSTSIDCAASELPTFVSFRLAIIIVLGCGSAGVLSAAKRALKILPKR